VPIKAARVAAQRIPGAKMVELPGAEHLPWLGDTAEVLAQLRSFVGAPAPAVRTERVLATILFTDLVGSTDHLTSLGDAAWTARLDRHAGIVREAVLAVAKRTVCVAPPAVDVAAGQDGTDVLLAHREVASVGHTLNFDRRS
jgi:class 3 adenylate cyclase